MHICAGYEKIKFLPSHKKLSYEGRVADLLEQSKSKCVVRKVNQNSEHIGGVVWEKPQYWNNSVSAPQFRVQLRHLCANYQSSNRVLMKKMFETLAGDYKYYIAKF